MQLQRLVVNMLPPRGEVQPQQFAMPALALQVQVEEGFGQTAAPTHLDPTQVGIFAHHRPPREEVPGAMLEVLQVHITDAGIVLQNQLHDAGLEGVFRAQQIIQDRDFGAFLGDQKRVMIAADAIALVQDRLQWQVDLGCCGARR